MIMSKIERERKERSGNMMHLVWSLEYGVWSCKVGVNLPY